MVAKFKKKLKIKLFREICTLGLALLLGSQCRWFATLKVVQAQIVFNVAEDFLLVSLIMSSPFHLRDIPFALHEVGLQVL